NTCELASPGCHESPNSGGGGGLIRGRRGGILGQTRTRAPMPHDGPFDRLMADLRGGRPEAAREVFDRYARRLVGLAAAKLPGFARAKLDPEDVVQSVFRTFFRRHADGQFRPEHWDALWSLLAVLTV